MSAGSFKSVILTVLLLLLVFPLFGQPQFAQTVVTKAEIVGLSSPVQVYRSSVIRVTAYIKNTGDAARSFYVTASLESWDRGTGNIWEDLPGWGTTSTINPGSTAGFTFGDYTILADEYIGYHGILVVVWTDSTRTTQLAAEWYENVVQVLERAPSAEITGIDIVVVSL